MIELAVKRYDGGNGSGLFTGCIPLKPGQLVETGIAQSAQASMSLWQGATEIGAYFSALYPQHSSTDPASVKSLMVSTTLNLDTATQPVEGAPLTLKIGTPRTIPGPAGHPTITRAWMKFPLLMGCIDPVHMCQSRIAFGPLVPMNDPRVLALPNWHAFLTNELENATTSGANGFPTFKLILAMLAARGDLGNRSGIFTPGSDIVTDIQGGNWPLPSSPDIGDAIVGMPVSANDGSFGGIFGTDAAIVGTTAIAEILGPNSVRLTHAVRTSWHGGTPVPRRYIAIWGTSVAAGNANYNALAIMYYRYLTAASGHLDKLRQAHLLAQDRYHDAWAYTVRGGPTTATNESGGGSITRGTGTSAQGIGRYNHPYTDELGVIHAVNEPFPCDEFEQPLNGNTAGDREDRSGFHQSAWMNYVLSGWGQALGNIIGFGFGGLNSTTSFSAFPGYPWQPDSVLKAAQQGGTSGFHTPSQQGFAGARLNFRLRREPELFYYMLSLPFDLNANPQAGPRMAPSPRTPGLTRDKWMAFWQRSCWDSFDLWSQEFAPSGANNSFLRGLWGLSAWYGDTQDGVQGATAAFQLQMVFNLMMTLHCNVKEDPRFPVKMGELGLWFAHQQCLAHPSRPQDESAPLTSPSATARPSNPTTFKIPYALTDPVLLAADLVGAYNRRRFWVGILLCLLTYAWRVTGDPKLLAMADGHATAYAMTDNIGAFGQPPDHKANGETYHMAFYALAFRVGETWGVPPMRPAELRAVQATFT